MAHGNFSDLVFFALLAIAIQFFAFQSTLFDGKGPWTDDNNTSDTWSIMLCAGSLLLMIGLMFSGIKWNPINGKMAGFGGFIAAIVTVVSTFQGDSDNLHMREHQVEPDQPSLVPHLFYLYAVVLFAGALHIFKFPSNPKPAKTPETKNNHGNFSDLIAVSVLCCALLCIFDPDHLTTDHGPLKAQFNPSSSQNGAFRVLIKFVGGLLLMIALIFSGVKWNPINGKMAGVGGFVAAGLFLFNGMVSPQSDVGFCWKPFYIYSAVLFAGALHIFAFPANPKPEPAAAEEGGAPLLA